ncbi:MAG: hypothetical protein L0H65_18550, partial [Pseudorhodobacter sp.]|nr:hypothetical protein [Pseudorhodobacter sp.]
AAWEGRNASKCKTLPSLHASGAPVMLIRNNMRQVFDLVVRIEVFRRGRICANLGIQSNKNHRRQ